MTQLPPRGAMLVFSIFTLVAATIAAWVTHIVVCLQTASWWLLTASAIIVPIGIWHGTGIWLGVF